MKAVHAGHRVATIKVRRRGYISRHSFTYSIASTSRHLSVTAQQPANKNCPRPASTKASVLHCGCRSFFSSTTRPTTKATCERPIMSNPQRPPLSSHSSAESRPYGDPFGDAGPPQIHFQEPQIPERGGMPQPFESTTSLPHEFGGQSANYPDDEEEKLPLTGNQGFVGGLYPPG